MAFIVKNYDDIGEFSSLEANGRFIINVNVDPTQKASLRLEGRKEDIESTTIQNENGTLSLENASVSTFTHDSHIFLGNIFSADGTVFVRGDEDTESIMCKHGVCKSFMISDSEGNTISVQDGKTFIDGISVDELFNAPSSKVLSKAHFNSGSDSIMAFIIIPALERINLMGSSEVEAELNTIKSEALSIGMTGSTYLVIKNADCTAITIDMKGSSDLKFEGKNKAKLLGLDMHGSGAFNSGELLVDTVNAHIYGSAEVYLVANNAIVDVSGSAEVSILADNTKLFSKGSAEVTIEALEADIDVSGSGEIHVDAQDRLSVVCRGTAEVQYQDHGSLQKNIEKMGKRCSVRPIR